MTQLNAFLVTELQRRDPPELNVIVQTTPGAASAVVQLLTGLGLSPSTPTFGRFIPVLVATADLDRLSQIEGVEFIHYDRPVSIGNIGGVQLPALPFMSHIPRIPSLTMSDPLIGSFGISPIEIPGIPATALFAPLGLLAAPLAPLLRPFAGLRQPQQSGFKIIPTSEARRFIGAPEQNKADIRVAVLDTGASFHPIFNPAKNLVLETRVPGETPFDGMGHGQWCASAAFANSWDTRFGRVRGVCDASNVLSVKCLSTAGFGATSWILAAMERAIEWGAEVISMSLGGPAQSSVLEDPMCQVIEQFKDQVIFVIAAGNDGAPWTIGTPGMSPAAITVGAWSTYYDGLADFSSRGPSSVWYRDNPEAWSRDLGRFGEDLVKPDMVAPGGGPVDGQTPTDLLYSAVTGYFDGFYDLLPDGFEPMRGTSQATPMVAGLIALAKSRGLINTADDVKNIMKRTSRTDQRVAAERALANQDGDSDSKSDRIGWGLIHWDRLTDNDATL